MALLLLVVPVVRSAGDSGRRGLGRVAANLRFVPLLLLVLVLASSPVFAGWRLGALGWLGVVAALVVIGWSALWVGGWRR